ncbi:Na+/H+ antiporter subunit E [Pseudochelatococcus sp. G4_1912]|uniref:Na+/H+ antiporter subunit E n=1 Tax=Pseudochelatococcus sp. G4_1912 TaxID=3114288 RepID=UPI0039C64EA9
MTRVVPYPLLSLSILVMWLLLNQSFSPAHIAFGTLLAIGGGWGMTTLDQERPRVRHPLKILVLGCVVFVDIVRSNIAVAKIIFRPGRRLGAPGFMAIPLDMRSSYGLATLAIIITSTPGTIWANFSPSSGMLLIHVLDLQDEKHWIDTIKNRYERRLMEIFE